MRWISFTIILLIAIVLEAGNLLNLFAIGGWYIRPAILITLLVFYAFSCRPRDAIICSFFIGFAADLTGDVMGPHMICFGLLGLLLNQSNQILYAQRAIYKALIVFAVYFVAETFSHWLGILKGFDAKDSYYSILLFTAIYSAVISPVIWSILETVSGGFISMKSQFDRTYR
jgi:rod shape-determining protein MreD